MSEQAKKQNQEEESVEQKHRSIRDLQSREIGFLRKLISTYPGFKSLNAGDQLDRMVLVLQSACGYGAVSEKIVQQIQNQLDWNQNFKVLEHFKNSEYHSEELNTSVTRYRESFEAAFCLKREYMQKLTGEVSDSSDNEPIRKKVPKKPSESEASSSPANTATQSLRAVHSKVAESAPRKSPTKASSINKPLLSAEQSAEQSAGLSRGLDFQKQPLAPAQPAAESEHKEENFGSPSRPKILKPWMVIAGLSVLIMIVALAFLFNA